MARFHPQIRACFRIWPAEHPAISRVAGDDSNPWDPKVDDTVGEHRGFGDSPCGQPGRMAPKLFAIANGPLAGRRARYLCRNRRPVSAASLLAAVLVRFRHLLSRRKAVRIAGSRDVKPCLAGCSVQRRTNFLLSLRQLGEGAFSALLSPPLPWASTAATELRRTPALPRDRRGVALRSASIARR